MRPGIIELHTHNGFVWLTTISLRVAQDSAGFGVNQPGNHPGQPEQRAKTQRVLPIQSSCGPWRDLLHPCRRNVSSQA